MKWALIIIWVMPHPDVRYAPELDVLRYPALLESEQECKAKINTLKYDPLQYFCIPVSTR